MQVVFKALILLHTLIRNGATDSVLSYLAGSDVLHLHNVYQGQWEGELLGSRSRGIMQLDPQDTMHLKISSVTLHTSMHEYGLSRT